MTAIQILEETVESIDRRLRGIDHELDVLQRDASGLRKQSFEYQTLRADAVRAIEKLKELDRAT